MKKISFLGILGIMLISLSTKVYSQAYAGADKVHEPFVYLYGGVYHPNISTDVTFYSPQFGITNSINLEKDLNFPSNVNAGYFKTMIGSAGQISFSAYSVYRNGGAQLSHDIYVGDNIYRTTAMTFAYLNTTTYAASFRYSIFHTPVATAGLSLGGRWTYFDAGIASKDGEFSFSAKQTRWIPVILPGVHGSVYITPQLLGRVSYEYFSLAIKGTRGTVSSGEASLEYFILRKLGIGASYSLLNYNITKFPDNEAFIRDINYSLNGFTVFAAARF